MNTKKRGENHRGSHPFFHLTYLENGKCENLILHVPPVVRQDQDLRNPVVRTEAICVPRSSVMSTR